MPTHISWTEETWNPVTGCTRVSEGCRNCYIERTPPFRMAHRRFDTHEIGGAIPVQLHPDRLSIPLHWRKPRSIFVCSLADLFHDDVPDEHILAVWHTMTQTPHHTYQVVTKRPARMRSFLRRLAFRTPTNSERDAGIHGRVPYLFSTATENNALGPVEPLANVWVGVSVEDQDAANRRIPLLLDCPAVLRWLSCEPLLDAVDLSTWMPAGRADWRCSGCHHFYSGEWSKTCPGCRRVGYWSGSHAGNGHPNNQPLSFVVVGGESGPGARPMHRQWVRDLRNQTTAAGVLFHFKQWGEWVPDDAGVRTGPGVLRRYFADGACVARVGKTRAGRVLDGREWIDTPATIREAVSA